MLHLNLIDTYLTLRDAFNILVSRPSSNQRYCS